ncbi:MAG: PAS domain-containing protein [Microthrixaceae bacterium]
MREPTIRPTGVERHFGDDEIIVSKTDTRGIITYVNELFVEMSAYPESELVGRPHSVIRHPDMPRCVFKLLWDTISHGSELFAYVVNLGADGAHYWVNAHVTPTFGRSGAVIGYHSNRRTASRSTLARIQPLYRSLLDAERRESGPVASMAAGAALLQATLDEAGATYEEFIWALEHEMVTT